MIYITQLLFWDFTDVTLASEDTCINLVNCLPEHLIHLLSVAQFAENCPNESQGCLERTH